MQQQQPQAYGMQQPQPQHGGQYGNQYGVQGGVQVVQPGMHPGMQPGMQPPGQQMTFMPAPPSIPGCPPGLEYLTQIDQLLVLQQIEMLEIFTGFETNNKYVITNTLGQQVYFAKEKTDCLMRMCCGPVRSFDIEITDNTGREVLHLSRPLKLCGCNCCPEGCLQELEVRTGDQIVGYIQQKTSCCLPEFDVCNSNREKVLHITGPFCQCGFSDIPFKIFGNDGSEIGAITKQFSGFVREAFTDADRFGITFPMNLDVNVKATLLGGLFLIDFMFFETKQDKNN